jgi:hypothetical protein
MTPSEQLVFDLCKKSFLSLWTYANPLRPNEKELCDVLLVFGDRVILFSVKESVLKKTGDPEVAVQRWLRTAVDASIEQLLGGQRQLATMTHVIRADGSRGIDLPPVEKRRVHLIAVAAGGDRSVAFSSGNKTSSAYVHVVDEFTLRAILGELDTTRDFLQYLDAKESFKGTIVCEGEENLLAIYLHRGRKLPDEFHLLVVEDGLWKKVQKRTEFRARKEQDRVSYWWDDMVERFIDDYQIEPERGPSLSDHERVVRTMAAEDRFARRALSQSFLDWLYMKQAGARNLVSPSDVAYVFATYPRDLPRERRVKDLTARCVVARSPSVMNRETVVGLGTEIYDPSGFSFDIIYINQPEWTSEDEELAQVAREGLDIMRDPSAGRLSFDEFPRATSNAARNRKKRERRSRR